MQIQFFKRILREIYNYIKFHDGETILVKDICKELQTTRPTVKKYLDWLEKRELIGRHGKKIWLTSND